MVWGCRCWRPSYRIEDFSLSESHHISRSNCSTDQIGQDISFSFLLSRTPTSLSNIFCCKVVVYQYKAGICLTIVLDIQTCLFILFLIPLNPSTFLPE